MYKLYIYVTFCRQRQIFSWYTRSAYYFEARDDYGDDDDDDNNNNNNSNNNNKETGNCTRKTFDRFSTKDSYTRNITHNTESTAV